jgi:hypothetical protein
VNVPGIIKTITAVPESGFLIMRVRAFPVEQVERNLLKRIKVLIGCITTSGRTKGSHMCNKKPRDWMYMFGLPIRFSFNAHKLCDLFLE